MAELQLVKESKYGRVGILGEATTVEDWWLNLQKKPFSSDAVFVSVYPLGGGAVVCDLNEIEYLGAPNKEQLDEILCVSGGFNPAADMIEKMMKETDV